MKNILIGIIGIFAVSCSINKESTKGIRIEWENNLDGDFLFKDKWNYGEWIFKNEYGQLVCDGLCPMEIESMRDDNGKIKEDSLKAYYELVDTAHYYYNVVINEWQPDSLWYIHVRKISTDSIECQTELGISTYQFLRLLIVGNQCYPAIVLISPEPDGDKIYPCTKGSLKIDTQLWKEGTMKALFQFTFYDSQAKQHFVWSGKIYENIENLAMSGQYSGTMKQKKQKRA